MTNIKCKLLTKFLSYIDMWPKNSCILQLRVIVCVILLIGVRVINVYVPLLTKDISKYTELHFS